MPKLTNHYLNREREFKQYRRIELSYLIMQAVARHLQAKSWTVKDLGKHIDMGTEQVTCLLNGTADLKLSTIVALEEALGSPLLQVDKQESLAFAQPLPPAHTVDL